MKKLKIFVNKRQPNKGAYFIETPLSWSDLFTLQAILSDYLTKHGWSTADNTLKETLKTAFIQLDKKIKSNEKKLKKEIKKK